MPKTTEKLGLTFILLAAMLWGLFPVFVNRGTQSIPPLTFAAISVLLAALGTFIYLVTQGRLSELKNKKAYKSLLMVTLCIVIIPYILFFTGASKTSGVNTSMLLLSEIIFTMIFTPFIGEKTTAYKILGAGGIFFGGLFIMYNGTLKFNTGDILIIFSTLTYPIGNFYAKKAFNLVSPATILFVRFLLGGIFIAGLAFFLETPTKITTIIHDSWFLILFNGLILLGVSKVLWYEGLKRLDISKASSLAMTFPLFSLLALIIFFNEKISGYQWVGIAIMMIGVYFAVQRKSVDQRKTKYANL